MKTVCPKCGLRHEANVENCDCGYSFKMASHNNDRFSNKLLSSLRKLFLYLSAGLGILFVINLFIWVFSIDIGSNNFFSYLLKSPLIFINIFIFYGLASAIKTIMVNEKDISNLKEKVYRLEKVIEKLENR